jgi:hypothetical protein
VGFVALVAAAAYGSRAATGPPDRNILYQWSTAFSELIVFGIIVAVTLAIARGRDDLLALRRPRSWRRALGYAALLFVGVFAVVSAIDPLLHATFNSVSLIAAVAFC